ncbi:unnamed protein product [Nyctereutes procyonoides]|uniref:(raccoon dog) hypothetical protein n=1 Tax=Nyctereutes procyonoides TaxID=34880 RepID=A0A811YUW7_NYCPR|nr:unnamed protein product [Nyctereutes procyonoides]
MEPASPSAYISASLSLFTIGQRCSSSDTSKAMYSLIWRISRAHLAPMLRQTYAPAGYFRKFEPKLYSLNSNSDDVDFLTEKESLSKYQLGMLHFSILYDQMHNHLTVRDKAHPNPYIKICLLTDQKNFKQRWVKCKTQKLLFEECYTLGTPFPEVQRRILLLTVVDFEKFSCHCVIGKVSLPLSEADLVKDGHWWKVLITSSQNEVELGELLLGITDPVYSKSFSIKVPQEELENANLVSGTNFLRKLHIVFYSGCPILSCLLGQWLYCHFSFQSLPNSFWVFLLVYP